MVQPLESLRDDFIFHIWPGWRFHNIMGATGLLAGLTAWPIEYAWSLAPHQHALVPHQRGVKPVATKPAPMAAFARNVAPGFIARAGIRFLAYGQFKRIRDVKREMGTNRWPKWVDIGVSGGAAGLVETVIANRFAHPMGGFPPMITLIRHPAKLFFCFGTFGYLTTNFAETQPPQEAWRTISYAAVAGGVGTAVTSAAEGLRGPALWANAVPRGACVIGTVIATQVMSAEAVFKFFSHLDQEL